MHRADPFMLDDEIADDVEAPAPLRPPLTPASPPARAPEPEQAKQPAPEPVRARAPDPEPVPVKAPEVKSAPEPKAEPKPEPQRQAPKPAPAPVSRTPGKRGRPKSANPKRQITLRLDAEVVDHFRAKGRGWQTRINSALRGAAGIDD